ncbi:MAG: hypothetical protein P1S60_18315, partial [Anaerolineae bacterium]|nr:hypothetical protein [Anaerolineae bacterium]
MMAFIGVDIGTTFIKGAVLDADGLHISHIQRIHFPDPVPGLPLLFVEFDPFAVVAAVRQLLDELLPLVPQCEGLVMCSQMHGLVLTSAQGV